MGTRIFQLTIFPLCVFAITISGLSAQPALESAMRATCEKPGGAIFEKGVIPNSATASAVAVQMLNAIYGAKNIASQLPLNIDERSDRYVINGIWPKHYVGGTATIILCRSNGAVLYMSHSK